MQLKITFNDGSHYNAYTKFVVMPKDTKRLYFSRESGISLGLELKDIYQLTIVEQEQEQADKKPKLVLGVPYHYGV